MKFYGVEMVTVSKAGLAELEQTLAHERGLREAAEAERDNGYEERQQIKTSLLEYIEAFKQEAADNIALKNKLEAAEAELIKARQYDREVRRALAPDPDIHLSDTIEAVYALWRRHDNMRAYASRLLAAVDQQRQALERIHIETDEEAAEMDALVSEGAALGVASEGTQ